MMSAETTGPFSKQNQNGKPTNARLARLENAAVFELYLIKDKLRRPQGKKTIKILLNVKITSRLYPLKLYK